MTIIITMAGFSSRFSNAGYVLPKYMLYVIDRSLFNMSVSSFNAYFKTCNFVFVARDLFDTSMFISRECELLGIESYEIVILSQPTSGQAETAFLGIEQAHLSLDEPILIFNIDTFRLDYEFPSDIMSWDGYLEVFKGEGKNWSYAQTESEVSTKVIETAEKIEISNNCSTGLYYFKSVSLYKEAYQMTSIQDHRERYIAPLYNVLIHKGHNIHIHVIPRSEVVFCGVPKEYRDYLREIVCNSKI